MKNMSKFKKRCNLLVCAVIALVLTFSCFSAMAGKITSIKAETPTDHTEITVSDGQFNVSSSAVLKSSMYWEGNYVGKFGGNVIAGIVDLSATAQTDDDFMEVTKLDQFEEFKNSKPTTPFGRYSETTEGNSNWNYPGTNSNALMINTNDTKTKKGTAYGFASSAINLEANSFYRFTVWAKTGEFKQNTGAVIKLSGFDYDIGFWNIDNSSEINNKTLGFCKYTIYVATDKEVSAVINLQVGDSYVYGDVNKPELGYIENVYATSGYAFFDNVTCWKLSANAFFDETDIDDEYTKVYNFCDADTIPQILSSEILTDKNGNDIGSFANGINGWNLFPDEDRDYGASHYFGKYNAGVSFSQNNDYGLESDPYTPNGNNSNIGDRNILVMSSVKYNASIGIESDDIEIERNKFYRLSVWVNSQNFDSDSNAALVVVGENNVPSLDNKLTPVVIDNIQGSGNMNTRYGWQKYYFYIRGSLARNCNIKLQLWLGYTSPCKGTVLFDEIRKEEITYSYFSANSSDGTLVSFDNEPSSSITNGRFYNAEDYDEEFPLAPSDWTAFGEVPSTGATGIILTDEEHYMKNFDKYLRRYNPISQDITDDYNCIEYPTMLLLAASSENPGYFGYTSPAITITSDTNYVISVLMSVQNMSDIGASLWLESRSNIISSIKTITKTNGFVEYKFYIQGDTPFEDGTGIDYTVELNIAMGTNNKNASGSIYVLEVNSSTITSDEFNEVYKEYKTIRRSSQITYDMYSFSALNFFGYDNTDKGLIKQSTSWNVYETEETADGKYKMGVFDPLNKEYNGEGDIIPKEITAAYERLKDKFDNVFTLRTSNSAVTAQLINPIKLEPSSYYLLTVSMAVIIHDGANSEYGAGLYLNSDGTEYSKYKFTKIGTTSVVGEKYEFRNYEFYIATSDEAVSVSLRASLGDASLPNRYVSGELYIANIYLDNLGSSNDSYEDSETTKVINFHVDASEEDPTDPNPDTDNEQNPASNNDGWWHIPTILFGVAILIAILGFAIRSIVDKVSRRQHKKHLNSYDRRFGVIGADDLDTEQFDDEIDVKEIKVEEVKNVDIEAFNDDEPETKIEEVKSEPTPKKQKPANDNDISKDFDE